LLIIIVPLALSVEGPRNCSTFMFASDSFFFVGHNLDETPGFHVPGMVCVNKRNTYREGIEYYELIAPPEDYGKCLIPYDERPGPKINWVSRYGSITFNSEGIDFPDGGINEEGLAIFEMSLGGTDYPFDEANPSIFMCLWIQYLLDNCATVDEVLENTENFNLQGWSWHYFVTDGTGDCAIIEFLGGKPAIHRGDDVKYPVLCNLRYDIELKRLKDYKGIGGGILSIFKKPPRFVRAARMLDQYDGSTDTPPRDYALELVEEISVKGWNKWGIVVDVQNMVIYFHTERNRGLRYASLDSFDFDRKPDQMLDIHTGLTGDVSAAFEDYTFDRNYEHNKERADHLFADRFGGLIDNGVTAEVYARRYADYSERMRSGKGR